MKAGRKSSPSASSFSPAPSASSSPSSASSSSSSSAVSFFPGRAAYKLWGALARRKIDLQGRICIDVGCAAGGFSSVLLHGGALAIYGFDVGYGQMDYALSRESRLILHERTDFRTMHKRHFQDAHWRQIEGGAAAAGADAKTEASAGAGESVGADAKAESKAGVFVTADISFLSGATVLEFLSIFFRQHKIRLEILMLIKPQFHASSQTQKGIMKDSEVTQQILANFRKTAKALGFRILEIFPTALPGRYGNQEFFLHALAGIA